MVLVTTRAERQEGPLSSRDDGDPHEGKGPEGGKSQGRTRMRHSGEVRGGDEGVKRVTKPRRRRCPGHGSPRLSRTDRNRRRDKNPTRDGRGRRSATANTGTIPEEDATLQGQAVELTVRCSTERRGRPQDPGRNEHVSFLWPAEPERADDETGLNRRMKRDAEATYGRTRRTGSPMREQNLRRVALRRPKGRRSGPVNAR